MVVVLGRSRAVRRHYHRCHRFGPDNKLLEPFTGAVLGKIFVLVIIILFIQKRPQGMFALRGRTAEAYVLAGFPNHAALRPARLAFVGGIRCVDFHHYPGDAAAGSARQSAARLRLLRAPDRQDHVLCHGSSRDGSDRAYAGILSLGHGLFFALGGYAMGMYLMRRLAPRDSTEAICLILWCSWIGKTFPLVLGGDGIFLACVLKILLVPGLLSLYLAACPSFAHQGVYFSIITQALTFASCCSLPQQHRLRRQQRLYRLQRILGFSLSHPGTRVSVFVITGIFLIATFLLCRYIVTSKFGRVLVAIRDAESRAMFSGYNTRDYTSSSGRCRPCYAASPARFMYRRWALSIPVRCRRRLYRDRHLGRCGWPGYAGGCFGGSRHRQRRQKLLSVAWPEFWLYFLGALFVVVTVFLPRGLMGWNSSEAQ